MARAARTSGAARRTRKSTDDTDGAADALEDSSRDALGARLIDAALAIAARDGWRAAGPAAIAAEAGVGLAVLYDHFPDRTAILGGLMRRIDRAVLAAPVETEGSPRDRLFDVLMRRFEALQPHRAGITAIVRAGVDPLHMAALAPAVVRSMGWMLAAAGLEAGGLFGRVRLAGLVVVYTTAFRAWLADDGADLGKTMAALDRGLAQAERWASALPHARR